MAETHQIITKVWIAPGCIVCDACENDCPEVFDVQEDTCLIRPPAQSADFLRPLTPSIQIAAEGCPVEVIKIETKEVEGKAPWADLPKLLALAAYPNVRVKISGACTLSREAFPYDDIWDPVLRIIDAFGIDRCMWGTDSTRTSGMLTTSKASHRFAIPISVRQRSVEAHGRHAAEGLSLVAAASGSECRHHLLAKAAHRGEVLVVAHVAKAGLAQQVLHAGIAQLGEGSAVRQHELFGPPRQREP